jgi:dipeptidyl aminopeptidase/acylaminoacyl peptidase
VEVTGGDVAVDAFDAFEDGSRMAVIMSTTTHPPDIFMADLNRTNLRYTRVTHVNPQVDTWKLPIISLVQWTSADGTPVEGVLELPPNYVPGRPLPMIVELHGGPTASTLLRLRYWIYGRTLMAAKGYALLSPNYRGSTGYGDKFLTNLVGQENALDVADILSGVDAMIEKRFADPDRLGVMGWSNGGYLTNCLITKTTRFKAASSGAGILDMALQWSTEDTPGHVVNFQQGLPWAREAEMRAASPLFELDKVATPTIIHVGGDDPRCPPVHSRGLYRALREYLDVPTELIVYPGAQHSLSTYTHRKAKMEWDIAWFDKYLLNVSEETTTPTDKES